MQVASCGSKQSGDPVLSEAGVLVAGQAMIRKSVGANLVFARIGKTEDGGQTAAHGAQGSGVRNRLGARRWKVRNGETGRGSKGQTKERSGEPEKRGKR